MENRENYFRLELDSYLLKSKVHGAVCEAIQVVTFCDSVFAADEFQPELLTIF